MAELSSEIQDLMSQRKSIFGRYFINQIYPLIQRNTHKRLSAAITYSLEAGGKKFRPILTMSAFMAKKNESEPSSDALVLGAACELIHTYSLIHDDLPSMDNDDLRRGIPTCHTKFSESTAILAGDGLNSLGFYLVSRVVPRDDDMRLVADLYDILHDGAGILGMVSGQSEDLEMDGRFGAPPPESVDNPKLTLERIHSRKTGALIISALLLGNRLRRDHASRESLVRQYGEKLGILYQVTDDILDVEGSREELGKTPGKDADRGKLTYVTLYGMDESKKIMKNMIAELESIGDVLESKDEIFFKKMPGYLGSRKK